MMNVRHAFLSCGLLLAIFGGSPSRAQSLPTSTGPAASLTPATVRTR
ncbi:MAG: hypothetical protein NVS3B25_27290 [Hymenobacter sp.]